MTDENENLLVLAIMKNLVSSSKDDKEVQEKMQKLASELRKSRREGLDGIIKQFEEKLKEKKIVLHQCFILLEEFRNLNVPRK